MILDKMRSFGYLAGLEKLAGSPGGRMVTISAFQAEGRGSIPRKVKILGMSC